MVFFIIGYMFHNRNCFEKPCQEDVIHEREVAWQATCHKDVGTPIPKHQETIEIVWRKSMKYDEILYPTWPCWYVYDYIYIIIYIYILLYIHTVFLYSNEKNYDRSKGFGDGPDDDLTGQQCLEKWWDRRIDLGCGSKSVTKLGFNMV